MKNTLEKLDENVPYHITVDIYGLVSFQFRQINEVSMAHWHQLHAEHYLSDTENPMLMYITLPDKEIMPYAHITRNIKLWLMDGNPVTPTRHAYVLRTPVPEKTIQGLLRTLPPLDLQVAFFGNRDEAVDWLLAEQAALNSQVRTIPLHKTG